MSRNYDLTIAPVEKTFTLWIVSCDEIDASGIGLTIDLAIANLFTGVVPDGSEINVTFVGADFSNARMLEA